MIKLLKRLNREFDELSGTRAFMYFAIPLVVVLLATMRHNWNIAGVVYMLLFMGFRAVGTMR